MSCFLSGTISGVNYYDGNSIRFTDKSNNSNEREQLFKNWWNDQIAQYGTQVTYFVRDFTLSAANKFFGENTTDGFRTGTSLVMAVDLTNNAVQFSQYGIMGSDELDAFIDIATFQETLSSLYLSGESIEPKAGDVFQLTEFGNDRVNGREGKFFEITERNDEDISKINPLQSHFLFKIKAARFDFSYTDNDVEETVSDQLTEDALSGLTTEPEQEYTNDLDSDQSTYFDYDGNDNTYGNYYD